VADRPLREQLLRLFRRIEAALLAFRSDKGMIFSAALAYYGALSIVPLLVMLIAVPGLLLRFSNTPAMLAADILLAAENTLGPEFRQIIENTLADLKRDSVVATLIALGGLLFSSSIVFRYISRCFRFIWQPSFTDDDNVSAAMRKTVVTKVLDRLIGVLMVLALSAALIVSVVIGTITAVLERLLTVFPIISDIASIALGPSTTLGIAMLVFLLLFKYIPPVTMRWADVWPSALICAIAWEVGKQALLFYIVTVGTRSSFGALTVILAVLFWLNANGLVLFFCAELAKVTAQERDQLEPGRIV
jgi:membrane protein